ncbi:flagellar motor protein MotB [Marinobacter halophilus]|uniref:Type VI secretion system protein TssL n=1 Tax=Marinobacter halophilus TaxID=1323740 RepID=A0A2T1KJ53_9GAMM|nr:flagellar motor protein MotB [Marinobacter halophilus]PSF10196.1 type VI secretion system protein TssL [Marinobacter halophilus]GGC68523.1 flagellar motor protein MotB [Marinobacter halophilus]
MDELPEEETRAIPAWVVTFADLMSLLMCFFVLLLSFSEIDAQKFKQIAGELSQAFGVQRDVPALEIPMGTSPIFDQFSPAPPEPTVVNEVKQTTTDQQPQLQTLKSPTDVAVESAIQDEMQETLDQILQVLEPAIADGRINVNQDQRRIVIRVEEKGSFPSGSAQLTWEFEGLLLEMAKVLAEIPGRLTVEGHTDNVPIRTERFYSNWDLSAARAAAVANVLLALDHVEPTRLSVTGLADTEPRVPNTSSDNRAKNRRVEIIIDLSEPMQEQEIRLRELIETQSDSQEAIIDIESGTPSSGELTW